MNELRPRRRHLSAIQKIQILQDLLESQESMSSVSEKYDVLPNDIFRWKKQLFNRAALLFMNKYQVKSNIQKENEKTINEILRNDNRF